MSITDEFVRLIIDILLCRVPFLPPPILFLFLFLNVKPKEKKKKNENIFCNNFPSVNFVWCGIIAIKKVEKAGCFFLFLVMPHFYTLR
jgi:hypothetical protein